VDWCDVQIRLLKEMDRNIRTLRQPGGVDLLANGKGTSHIVDQGGDARHLGRWRWVTLQGKDQKKTCIIGVYKTAKPNDNPTRNLRRQPSNRYRPDRAVVVRSSHAQSTTIREKLQYHSYRRFQ